MYCHILKQTRNIAFRPSSSWPWNISFRSRTVTTSADYDSKYGEKLRRRALEKGLTVDALRAKAKEEQAEEAHRRREVEAAQEAQAAAKVSVPKPFTRAQSTSLSTGRKDSSPVKVPFCLFSSQLILAHSTQPLTSILNLQKLMATSHTPDQIGALWTAYHLSKSGGTGRGYVCAAIPLELYKRMVGIAEQYPTFVVPVRREKLATEPEMKGEEDVAYEFYFLQWDFHHVPPVPSATDDLFASSNTASAGVNPRISTILFTPLQEYKMRAAFATPYLVLTHYTDLAFSHGVVLLRGEITPNSGGSGSYMLTQKDAQILSMAVQKFYLWDSQDQASAGLLKCFHEKPHEFEWEKLLENANLI